MKYPLKWHKEWLENQKLKYFLAVLRTLEIDKIQSQLKVQIEIRASQIQLAEQRGLTEFDAKKLGVEKKKVTR